MTRRKAECWLVCSVLLLELMMGTASPARSAQVKDFPFYAPLSGDEYGMPAMVALPRDILAQTSLSLKDIGIFDDLGREVPFLLVTPGRQAPGSIRWEIRGSHTIGEDLIYLLGRGTEEGFVDGLTVLSGQAWACSDIEVFSSFDGSQWQPLAEGRIMNLRPRLNARRMSIRLPETHTPFLKVVFRKMRREGGVNPFGCLDRRGRETDLSDPPSFNAVQGFESSLSRGGPYGADFGEEAIEGFRSTLDSQGNTVIDLGKVSLPVTEVSFRVDQGCFYRDVQILSAGREQGSSYALKVSGSICEIPGLRLSRRVLEADLGGAPGVRIRIMNRGEPAPALRRITLRWPRVRLLFVPQQGRAYSLCYGGSEMTSGSPGRGIAPGGDVKVLWKAGPPVVNESYRPRGAGADDIRSFFIMGVIILVIYCIGFWAIQIRNMAKG